MRFKYLDTGGFLILLFAIVVVGQVLSVGIEIEFGMDVVFGTGILVAELTDDETAPVALLTVAALVLTAALANNFIVHNIRDETDSDDKRQPVVRCRGCLGIFDYEQDYEDHDCEEMRKTKIFRMNKENGERELLRLKEKAASDHSGIPKKDPDTKRGQGTRNDMYEPRDPTEIEGQTEIHEGGNPPES